MAVTAEKAAAPVVIVAGIAAPVAVQADHAAAAAAVTAIRAAAADPAVTAIPGIQAVQGTQAVRGARGSFPKNFNQTNPPHKLPGVGFLFCHTHLVSPKSLTLLLRGH